MAAWTATTDIVQNRLEMAGDAQTAGAKAPIAIRGTDTTIEDVRLPPYFPLKLRACMVPADDFFACFTRESTPNGDQDVSRRAVLACAEQLELYKKCMDSYVGPRAPGTQKQRKWLGFW